MNYLILVLRRLVRNWLLTTIHVLSLAAGISGCLFIFTYCYHQLTYDQYHGDLNRLFRVNSAWVSDNGEQLIAITPGSIAQDLKIKRPFIEATGYVTLLSHNPSVSVDLNQFETEHFYPSSQGLLEVFRFDFLNGNKSTALTDPYHLVLSKAYAERMFGSAECIGRSLIIRNQTYQVAGVYENWPANVDFKINGLFFDGTIPKANDRFAYRTFVKTVHEKNLPELYHALADLADSYAQRGWEVAANISFRPQSFKRLHFKERLMGDTPKSNINFVYFYMLTGSILLVIVFTNLINLNFIRNADLIKPFGLMQILGSSKRQIIYQSLLENILIFLFASLLSITLFQIVIHSNVSIGQFHLQHLKQHPEILGYLLICFLGLVFLTGYLTTSASMNCNLVGALRKEVNRNLPIARFRHYLVMFQYLVCLVLMSVLVILWRQYQYIQNKELGFAKEDVLVVELSVPDDFEGQELYQRLISQFGQNEVSTTVLNGKRVSFSTLSFPGETNGFNVANFGADPNFLEIMNISLLQGEVPPYKSHEEYLERNIHKPLLINETLAREMEDPIGTEIIIDGWLKGRVVGILKDFHFQSLHNHIAPAVINTGVPRLRSGIGKTVQFVVRSNDPYQHISSRLKQVVGEDHPFIIRPITDVVLNNYDQEQQALNVLTLFAIISILVACLGIFGIVHYALQKRKFELGMRKVLGANLVDLIFLFGFRILQMFWLALMVCLPFIWIIKNIILDLYAYQKDVVLLWLLTPALVISGITALLVYFTVKAAYRVNPSELLREE